MIGPWTIGAQLSTSHSSPAALDEQRMLDSVRRVLDALNLDLLIIGFREAPEVFEVLCVGRLTQAKGQHLLIDAVRLLARHGRRVRLRSAHPEQRERIWVSVRR